MDLSADMALEGTKMAHIKSPKASIRAGQMAPMVFLIIYSDININSSAPEYEGEGLKVEKKDVEQYKEND